jgi:ribosome biogenesis protein MAK21
LALVKKVLSCSLHSNASVAAASIFLIKEVSKHQDVLNYCCHEVLNSVEAARYLDTTKRDPRYAVRGDGDDEATKNDDGGDADTNKSTTTTVTATIERKLGLWELTLLQHHYHPTVSKFATFDTIDYSGDPLVDFSVPTFLDKFAYRNPKKQKSEETAADQPNNNNGTKKRSTKIVQTPVNDAKFWSQGHINVEDAFFQTFFHQRAKRNGIKKQQEDDEEQVDQDWGTDEEEETFVDSLAEGLLKAKAADPVDLDDEDPDTSGWNDMYDGSDDENDEDDDDDDDPPATMPNHRDEDDDAFMEVDDSSSDEDGNEEVVDHDDPLEVADDVDDEEEDELQLQLLAAAEASDDDDDVAPMLVKRSGDGEDAFADADEYADLIAESFSNKKQKTTHRDDAATKKRNKRNKN